MRKSYVSHQTHISASHYIHYHYTHVNVSHHTHVLISYHAHVNVSHHTHLSVVVFLTLNICNLSLDSIQIQLQFGPRINEIKQKQSCSKLN
jgi:hypothetical protein